MMDTKGEDGVRYIPVRPCRFDEGRLRTFYHTDYFRSAVGFDGKLLLSNHTVLHARTDYEDHPKPELKRHLLRLWISLPGEASLASQLRRQRSRAGMLATLLGTKLGHGLRRAVH
ncbi:MAG: hypothetical protein WBM75_02795 [Polyangiales bacterium]|jgi:hypothetical protein